MKKKLTKKFIESLKASGKEQIIHDEEIKGLELRVSTAGRKAFSLRYKNKKSAKRMRYKIGDYPVSSLDSARQTAITILQEVQSGKDPSNKQNDDITVAELCDIYMARGADHKKKSTREIDAGRIKRHIVPLVGKIKISLLNRKDIYNMMKDIESGKTAIIEKTKARGVARVTGGKMPARDCTALLSSMLTFAVNEEMIESNTALGIKLPPIKSRTRFLNINELANLGAELNKPNNHSHASNIIKLALLTGCRRNEIASLKWGYIDEVRQCIDLPDSKTDQRLVPIGKPVLAFIKTLPKFHQSDYVFPSHRKKGAYYTGTPKHWNRMSKAAGISDCRFHDLRHTFASIAGQLTCTESIIGGLLGHSRGTTTGKYTHFELSDLGQWATKVSRVIEERLEGPIQNSFQWHS